MEWQAWEGRDGLFEVWVKQQMEWWLQEGLDMPAMALVRWKVGQRARCSLLEARDGRQGGLEQSVGPDMAEFHENLNFDEQNASMYVQ